MLECLDCLKVIMKELSAAGPIGGGLYGLLRGGTLRLTVSDRKYSTRVDMTSPHERRPGNEGSVGRGGVNTRIRDKTGSAIGDRRNNNDMR